MISCITYSNIHLFNKAYISQYKLRHRCFIERQGYDVWDYNGMEYDQYDNPSANYLVYQSMNGEALGVSRMTPISHRSMVKDLWPDLISNKKILSDPNVWEATRFCIDKNINQDFRKIICQELVCSYLEFGLQHNIKKIIGVMPPLIFRSIFKSAGVDYEPLGPIIKYGNDRIQAAAMKITKQQLFKTQTKTNTHRKVLLNDGRNYQLQRAA